jgi:hypothetical protein
VVEFVKIGETARQNERAGVILRVIQLTYMKPDQSAISLGRLALIAMLLGFDVPEFTAWWKSREQVNRPIRTISATRTTFSRITVLG